ncbi:MAG: chromosome segregation protein SMC [Ignavibacteria bacterium RBG_16_34_14]|nr:MAG: chromosome segregation protein SMC [Ignavibacteria bacterium RBG_16_34_14]
MYLSKLEIFGFKSFAQKTNIIFNDGITSIVGPNGCGKTNIVDAIRWCLGEQRSSALRSDKMENVIFNGTATKKPMGMSEVSLTIQNTKGILPTDYSEVTITRRIFRSGESEYLLNKNICRLKDITNLFMDTGIGANAYSVIELKMVETILSNKAEERRVMFEEAAGVNKYKLRRRLALRKLEEVKTDLTRVNDIVTEVEKQVNSLERQAKKANRYNRLSLTLREKELDLAERELALFNREKADNKNKKEVNFKIKINLESQLSGLEDKIKDVKQHLADAEAKLKIKRDEVTSQRDEIYNQQKKISVEMEKKRSLEENIARYIQELEELKTQLAESERIINEGSLSIQEFEKNITSKTSSKLNLEQEVVHSKSRLEEKRNEVKTENQLLVEQVKEITNKENELANLQKQIEVRNTAIAKANEKIQSYTNNIAKTVGFISELNDEKSKTEAALLEAEAEYSRKQKEKEELEKELNHLKEKEVEIKTVINGLNDKISFIQTLIDNLEGVSKGAKALLESSEWTKKDKTLLAYAGNTSEEFRFAIEAALKSNLNNVLVDSIEELKKGIKYLKEKNIGKAGFYLTDFDQKENNGFLSGLQNFFIRRKCKSLAKEKGFLGWAKDSIKTEPKWRTFFDKILNNTAIVNSLDSAFRLRDKYTGFNFTTLNGDYVQNSGVIEGGSLPKADDSLFGRKQYLDKIKSELPVHEKELEKLLQKINNTEETISSIDLKDLSDQGRMLVNDLANIEKQIAQFEFEKKRANDEIEKTRQEIKDLAGESNEMDNDRIKLEDLANSLRMRMKQEEKKRENLEAEFTSFEEEFNNKVSELSSINLELERLSGEKRNTENSVQRAEESIDNIKRTIVRRETDIENSSEEISSLNDTLRKGGLTLNDLEEKKEFLLAEEEKIDLEYAEIKSEINNIEAQQSSLRKERERVQDEIHISELKLNELSLKMENLKEHIKESYSLSLEQKIFDDLDTFNFMLRTEEVNTLKQQIKNLGPINLLAYSEYEEEKQRFDFLSKQRDDLLESEKDIVKTIEEINITAQTLFMDTFEKIRENFINIFRGLFNPGDEADLKFEESAGGGVDPLEAKIEIIAKPKGKRPTSIELLSGGEKTLTAIALLFAIYLVKPSPFCILDEIDAPLDDANIDRFTKIIKDFSKDTQFIVVTHNKRTMEAADILYGVTMQEEGVSKLVAVRFNEDLSVVS